MKPLDMFQLYLLSQMRAKDRVRVAMQQLGYGVDGLEEAVETAQGAGLEQPGHPMSIYAQLLGIPSAEEFLESGDPYQRRRHLYRLPLWPTLALTVVGSERGETAGISFIGEPQLATPLRQVNDLKPWEQTENQLAELLSAASLQDEWYPQKDYACAGVGATVGDFVLRFDFGLLQQVLRQRENSEA